MDPIFTRHLGYVRRREGANRFLAQLAQALLGAAAIVLGALIVERLFAVAILTDTTLSVLGGIAAAALLVRFLWTRPDNARLALLVDARLAFKERFSTSLAFAASDDSFARAARAETAAAASHLDLRRRFPVRLTRPWIHAGGIWLLALLVFALMPVLDLLGREEERMKIEAQQQALADAQAQVKEVSSQVQEALRGLDAPELARKLDDVAPADTARTPGAIRTEALRKLGEIADRLAELAQSEEAEAARALRMLMKKLRIPRDGPSRDFSRALARGKFAEAEEILKRLRRAREEGSLSDEDARKLAQDLKDLAAQLDKSEDEAARELENALQDAGLLPDLARLSASELAEALRKAGLADAKALALLKKARALKNAGRRARSLGKGCGSCAGGEGGEGDGAALEAILSSAAAEELGEQLALQRELLDRLARLEATGMSIEGLCQGLGEGGIGPWQAGEGVGRSTGSGGPGQGGAPVPTDRSGSTVTKSSRVENEGKDGPAIATWLANEEQMAGEARRTLSQAVTAAKDVAAEAIRDNRIPAKYRDAVARYFDELAGPPPAEAPPAATPPAAIPPAPPPPAEE